MAGTLSTVPAPEMDPTSSKKTVNPPPVISVETGKPDDHGPNAEVEKGFVQARTPKHANKTREDEQKITPDRGDPKHEEGRPPYGGQGHYGNYPPPPRPYEGRPLGGGGAFQPHESRRQPPPHYTLSSLKMAS